MLLAREGPIEVKKTVKDFANVEGVSDWFIVRFQFIHGTTLLFSQFTVRALVNGLPNFVWVTDVIQRFIKIRFTFFGLIVFLLLKRFPF